MTATAIPCPFAWMPFALRGGSLLLLVSPNPTPAGCWQYRRHFIAVRDLYRYLRDVAALRTRFHSPRISCLGATFLPRAHYKGLHAHLIPNTTPRPRQCLRHTIANPIHACHSVFIFILLVGKHYSPHSLALTDVDVRVCPVTTTAERGAYIRRLLQASHVWTNVVRDAGRERAGRGGTLGAHMLNWNDRRWRCNGRTFHFGRGLVVYDVRLLLHACTYQHPYCVPWRAVAVVRPGH